MRVLVNESRSSGRAARSSPSTTPLCHLSALDFSDLIIYVCFSNDSQALGDHSGNEMNEEDGLTFDFSVLKNFNKYFIFLLSNGGYFLA